jgi:hypothetical protein
MSVRQPLFLCKNPGDCLLYNDRRCKKYCKISYDWCNVNYKKSDFLDKYWGYFK